MQKPDYIPADYDRIKIVGSIAELFDVQFDENVNAALFPRRVSGDFNGLAQCLRKERRLSFPMLTPAPKGFEREVGQIVADYNDVMQAMYGKENPFRHFSLRVYDKGWDTKDPVHNFHVDGCSNPTRSRVICCYNDPVTEWVRNEDVVLDHPRKFVPVNDNVPVYSFHPGDIFRIAALGTFSNKPDGKEDGLLFIHRTPQAIADRKPEDPPRLMFVAG